jgi:hypothetical protein
MEGIDSVGVRGFNAISRSKEIQKVMEPTPRVEEG